MAIATEIVRSLKAIIDRRNSLLLDDDQTAQIQALANMARGLGLQSVADQCENVLALDHNNRIRRTRSLIIGRDQTDGARSRTARDQTQIELTETDQTSIDGARTAVDCRYLLPDRTEIDQTEILCAFENGRGQTDGRGRAQSETEIATDRELTER
jgi:hypothetical protein